jgi:hypothetical protein
MTSGTHSIPEPDRHDFEFQLQKAVDEARAAMTKATDPVERAAAAERLKVAVQKLMDFTWNKGRR